MQTIQSSPVSLDRSSSSYHEAFGLSQDQVRNHLLKHGTYGLDEVSKDLLIISPYVETPHLLDLRTLEPQAQMLAVALTNLKSLRADYATAPYVEIFNWTEVIANLRQLIAETGQTWNEQKFYIVVFRSQIPATTDYSHLGVLDKAAHAEAMKSGGFLKSVVMNLDRLRSQAH